jgi:hypothetical protein
MLTEERLKGDSWKHHVKGSVKYSCLRLELFTAVTMKSVVEGHRAFIRTDVSEERIVSIIKVTRIG